MTREYDTENKIPSRNGTQYILTATHLEICFQLHKELIFIKNKGQ
jgi:hypothetical protein